MELADIALPHEEAGLSAKQGTSDPFGDIYGRFGRTLYGTALRMLGRPEEAEEAMQETFLALYSRGPRLGEARLGAWLHRVLVNECIDRVRRRQRWRMTPVDEQHLAPAPALADGAALDLERAVRCLPEGARVVFLLHDVEGFKHHEVGAMLGLATGTTKSQLWRARRMLRELMGLAPRGD